MILKLAAVEGALVAIIVAASNALDGTAEKIVLFAAAGAGLLWFWANIAKPAAKIIRKAASAMDSLEHLPQLAKRVGDLEQRADKAEKRDRMFENVLAAIVRELGIEDQVRQMDPEDFGVKPEDA